MRRRPSPLPRLAVLVCFQERLFLVEQLQRVALLIELPLLAIERTARLRGGGKRMPVRLVLARGGPPLRCRTLVVGDGLVGELERAVEQPFLLRAHLAGQWGLFRRLDSPVLHLCLLGLQGVLGDDLRPGGSPGALGITFGLGFRGRRLLGRVERKGLRGVGGQGEVGDASS